MTQIYKKKISSVPDWEMQQKIISNLFQPLCDEYIADTWNKHV